MALYDYSEIYEIVDIFMPLIIMFAVIFFISFALSVTQYVLRGIAIYKMSASRGIPNGWMGFIPYVHNYQFGQIAGEIELGNKKIKNTGTWLLIIPFIYSFIVSVCYFATMIPYFISMYSIVSDPTPEGLIGPIITLMISMIFYILIIMAAQVVLYLFKYLALHKVFSQYNVGQKPVFYVIIAMFVPLAEPIILFIHSKRPMLETKSIEESIE